MLHGCRQLVSWDVWFIPVTERNPYLLYVSITGNLDRYCQRKWEEGGDEVKSSWPLWTGLHTCYNGKDSKLRGCKPKPIFKPFLSSDWGLQLAPMKLESLVIADQDAAVNTSLNLAHTARHVLEVDLARRFWNKLFKNTGSNKEDILLSMYLKRKSFLRTGKQLGWSRNKVVVGEPAAGIYNYEVRLYV